MTSKAHIPEFFRATVKTPRKKRFSLVNDENFITLMKAVGRRFSDEGRSVDKSKGETLLGVYVLPTNNVIEIIKDADNNEFAVLFNNIDVWMSFELSDLEKSH